MNRQARSTEPASGSQLSTIHYQLKLAARVGLAPTPNGLTDRRATLTLPGNGDLGLPAGVAPALVRLEDERLVYFGHGSSRAGLMHWRISELMGRRSAPQQSNNPPSTNSFRDWSEQQDFHLSGSPLGPSRSQAARSEY